MKKIFLNVLAIVLMASGLQVNQAKAKLSDEAIDGLIATGVILAVTTGIIGGLIYSGIKNQDTGIKDTIQRLKKQFTNYINSTGRGEGLSVSEQNAVVAEMNNRILQPIQEDQSSLASGNITADNFSARIVARVSNAGGQSPQEIMQISDNNNSNLRSLPKKTKGNIAARANDLLNRVEQFGSQVSQTSQKIPSKQSIQEERTEPIKPLTTGAADLAKESKGLLEQASLLRQQMAREHGLTRMPSSSTTIRAQKPITYQEEFYRPRQYTERYLEV